MSFTSSSSGEPKIHEVVRLARTRKKFALGSDADKEAVFDFPYLLNEETVSYIHEHGKIMFLIRGPPSTAKATLSELFTEKYETAVHCCADHYFKNSFASPERTRESLKASHAYCAAKADDACANSTNVVIIQNTHMRKWEMQHYIDLAAKYNYVVIMAITLYRFDVTPESLLANNTDGLNIEYFRRRLKQWEDIPPVLTGWFLGPKDAAHVQNLALDTVKELVSDGKFCRVFEMYDADEVPKYFQARKLLYCLAGYTDEKYEMKKYYLSPTVQYLYGKCIPFTIVGYHVTPTRLNAVVDVTDLMQLLVLDREDPCGDMAAMCGDLDISDSVADHNAVHAYEVCEQPETSTVTFGAWAEGEGLSATGVSFVQLAQKGDRVPSAGTQRIGFKQSMKEAADDDGVISDSKFTELGNGVRVCRLVGDEWLVKASRKIHVKSIFTGLYE